MPAGVDVGEAGGVYIEGAAGRVWGFCLLCTLPEAVVEHSE